MSLRGFPDMTTDLEFGRWVAPLPLCHLSARFYAQPISPIYDRPNPPLQTSAEYSGSKELFDYPEPKEALPSSSGARAWLTIFGAFLALFCTFGQINAFGTLESWYAHHQLHHLSPSTISWIGSLQLWVFFFAGGAIGRTFDMYGPTGLMTAGSAVLTLSMMLTSIATRYYHFMLTQGVLFGLGTGLMFYPSLAAVSTSCTKYRATALGVVVSGSSVGGFVWPLVFERLLPRIGFGWTLRVCGLISLTCCLMALAILRRPAPLSTKKHRKWIDTSTFSDLRFILLTAGSILVSLGLYTPFFYLVDYALSRSMTPQEAIYVLSIMNAFGVFGRTAPAYLADIIGHFNILFPAAFFSGLSCLTLWLFATTHAEIMIFAAVYGFWSGAFSSVVTPCVARISEIDEVGTRFGMLFSFVSIPSLLGSPLAGILLGLGRSSAHGSYTPLIAMVGTTIMLGSFFILWTKLVVDRRLLARV